MSLAYGVITVIVLFVIVFLGIRSLAQRNGEVSQEAQNTNEAQEQAQNTYEVKEGDTLFSISEQVYNDGYLWPTIAAANKIERPETLEKGTKLQIPEKQEEVAQASPTGEAQVSTDSATQQVPQGERITADTYTIKEGDTLWDISIRAYGDGYRWPELAQVNAIQNPDLIYPGNTLKLPR